MNWYALRWRPGAIALVEVLGGEVRVVAECEAPGATGSHRHDLALFPGADRPIVRLAGAGRAPFLRREHGALVPVEPVPGSGGLSAPRCRAHANGTLTAIDDGQLWVRARSPAVWSPIRVPEPLRLHDVSITRQGEVVVVGDMPAPAGAARQAAMAVLDSEGGRFLELDLAPKDRKRLEAGGGAESFQRVDVEARPYLVSSTCAWLFDDPSDFVLVGTEQRWRSHKLKRQAVRGWYRKGPEAVTIYTAEGRRHETRDGGASFRERDLIPHIRSAWSVSAEELIVRAVAAHHGELLLAVTAYDGTDGEDGGPTASALVRSVDDAQTFVVLAAAGRGEEWVGVVSGTS